MRPFQLAKNKGVVYLALEGNPGCGAATIEGMLHAQDEASLKATHFLVLDDDAVLEPAVIENLLSGIIKNNCLVITPLLSIQKAIWSPDPSLYIAVKEKFANTRVGLRLGGKRFWNNMFRSVGYVLFVIWLPV